MKSDIQRLSDKINNVIIILTAIFFMGVCVFVQLLFVVAK